MIEELAGLAAERTVRPELFFWRTSTGAEVDLLIRDGRRLVPIEIKSGADVDRHQVAGLRRCWADPGLTKGYVIANTKSRCVAGRADIAVSGKRFVQQPLRLLWIIELRRQACPYLEDLWCQ